LAYAQNKAVHKQIEMKQYSSFIQKKTAKTLQTASAITGNKGNVITDNRSVKTTWLTVQKAAMQRPAHPVLRRKANNTGLPDNLKTGIENLSGIAMDDVKVHYNSPQPAQLQAHAYAQGTDIHVAPGQERHLPHEAWHVVQQKQGRVRPAMQLKGRVNVNDDTGLEKEADRMGAKAVQQRAASPVPLQKHSLTTASLQAAVQRVYFDQGAGFVRNAIRANTGGKPPQYWWTKKLFGEYHDRNEYALESLQSPINIFYHFAGKEGATARNADLLIRATNILEREGRPYASEADEPLAGVLKALLREAEIVRTEGA
jgi:Domain of unknown function (DUF4157)